MTVDRCRGRERLQRRIIDDPTLLGLGYLIVKHVKRRPPRARRFNLLMSLMFS